MQPILLVLLRFQLKKNIKIFFRLVLGDIPEEPIKVTDVMEMVMLSPGAR